LLRACCWMKWCKVEYLAGLAQSTPMRSIPHYEPSSALRPSVGMPFDVPTPSQSGPRSKARSTGLSRPTLHSLPISLTSPYHMTPFPLRPLSCPRYAIAPLFLLGPQRDRRLPTYFHFPPSRATRRARVDDTRRLSVSSFSLDGL
jgi:hypothetical protein